MSESRAVDHVLAMFEERNRVQFAASDPSHVHKPHRHRLTRSASAYHCLCGHPGLRYLVVGESAALVLKGRADHVRGART